MILRFLTTVFIIILLTISLSSCYILHQGSKYGFNDGIYQTKIFTKNEVYVLAVTEDTIAVFPVLEFKDSTAVLTKQRVNYTSLQRKFKDNKVSHTFYKPSFDLDVMTVPVKYRFPIDGLPNQLTTNFNGALFGGYRIDAYKINYKRTPLNTYKQKVKHIGYSAGLYAGIGSTLVDATTLDDPGIYTTYEGVIFIAGICANMAVENLTVGISLGEDHLLDQNRNKWIYEGRPCIGFTLGLNIN